MATFAAVYPSKSSWQLQLDVAESSLEPWNNRSYVSWALYIYRGNGDTPWNNSGSAYSVSGPGGVSGTFGAYRFGSTGTGTNYSSTPVGGRVLIASGGDWVAHNPDGTGAVTVSASHAAASTLGTATVGSSGFGLTTLTQAPGVPSPVALAYTSDTQATVSWTNNYASNGAPTVNEIDRSVNGGAWVRVANISPASSLVIGAAANQKLVARVHASNGAGGSGWSATTNAVFTTPAAPSSVAATKDAAQDVTVSWTPSVAFTEHQHVVEHGTVAGGVTTWDGSPLATVSAGTSSFKHVAPAPSDVHVYRVRSKNTDVGALQSATVLSNTVQLLVAPGKPTIPTFNAFADKAADFDLSWVHNPVDTTPQSAFEVEYSTNGGSSWTSTGKVSSAVSERTFTGGTYAANVALTVRVRTWGQAASGGADGTGASVWSDNATVTFKTRPVVTVTTPANASVWAESDLTVALGFAQAEGASFVQATVELSDGVDVLEARVSTTLTGILFDTQVLDGGSYTVTVSVVDSHGIVSAAVVSSFTVAYTLPVQAGLTVTYLPGDGVAQLDVTVPTPGVGEAAAVSVSVFRTITARETIVAEYPVAGSSVTFIDTTPTVRGTNTYTVRTHSADGATLDTTVALVTAEDYRAFLSTGPGFANIVSFFGNLTLGLSPSRSQALVRAAGRRRPIALFGEGGDMAVSGSATLFPGEGSTPEQIEAFLLDAGIVCYRDPTGRRMFGTVVGSVEYPSSLSQEFRFTVTEAS